jgi:hypothetical protein
VAAHLLGIYGTYGTYGTYAVTDALEPLGAHQTACRSTSRCAPSPDRTDLVACVGNAGYYAANRFALDLVGLTTHESRRVHVSISCAGRRKMALDWKNGAPATARRRPASRTQVHDDSTFRLRALGLGARRNGALEPSKKAPVRARFRLVLDRNHCAADCVPIGLPRIVIPPGSGRAATLKPRSTRSSRRRRKSMKLSG